MTACLALFTAAVASVYPLTLALLRFAARHMEVLR